MNIKQALTFKPAALALMLLMAVTRFDHFGTPFALPDASLAVFFLAGLWLGGRYLFMALLLEAGVIDYLAITQLGVSDFCLSWAYAFLIPAYAAMWRGGKWCRNFSVLSLESAVQQLAVLVAAISIAFLLSSSSFYLLSDKIPNHTWGQFFEDFATYYPPYLGSSLLYAVLIVGLVAAVNFLLSVKRTHETV